MPCMVHKIADCTSLLSAQDFGKSALFCMVSIHHFLPPAVFQKVLAMCIRKWPIVEQKGQKSLYCGLCKFNIDTAKNYKLLIFLVGYAIHVRIENYVSTNEPPTAICTEVRLFLVQSLRSVLLGIGFSDDFRECIQCPGFDPLDNGGYFDVDLLEDQVAITCDDCELSHGLQTEALISCWSNKKQLNQVENDSLEQEPAEIEDRDDNAADNQNNDDRDISDAFGTNSYDEETPITQDHINHARVCNALVSVGADALREILLFKVPTGFNDIYDAINANRGMLFGMRQLRQEQLSLIYPDPHDRYTGTVDQFDISLLYTLIRNLSSVQAPVNGWGQPPDDHPRDTSLGANVERIRSHRNKISGHSMDGKLDSQCFETYWGEIVEMIDDIEKAIGDRGFKDALILRKI